RKYRKGWAELPFPQHTAFVAALGGRLLTICPKIAWSPSPRAPLFSGKHKGSERAVRHRRQTTPLRVEFTRATSAGRHRAARSDVAAPRRREVRFPAGSCGNARSIAARTAVMPTADAYHRLTIRFSLT